MTSKTEIKPPTKGQTCPHCRLQNDNRGSAQVEQNRPATSGTSLVDLLPMNVTSKTDKEQWKRFWKLFHELWGHSPKFTKERWLDFQELALDLQDAAKSAARQDTERLDWLDSQKRENSAHWGGRDDSPTVWVDPSASWKVRARAEDGTYKYPAQLKSMTVREAIDAARCGLDEGEQKKDWPCPVCGRSNALDRQECGKCRYVKPEQKKDCTCEDSMRDLECVVHGDVDRVTEPVADNVNSVLQKELPGALELALGVRDQRWPHIVDARVWADEWLKTLAQVPGIATDRDTMIGWFANAIMAGYDTASMRTASDLKGADSVVADGSSTWSGVSHTKPTDSVQERSESDSAGRVSHCKKHGTFPEGDDPCWQCVVEHTPAYPLSSAATEEEQK